MAKKSHKRPSRPAKDNAGCISGLISMFDFRQGRSTQKLLPDRKHGSSSRHGGTVHSRNNFDVLSNLEENHQDDSDADTNEERKDNSVKASIKMLMAEEMSRARTSKRIPSSRVEQIRAELGIGDILEKDYKERQIKRYSIGSDHNVIDLRASRSISSEPSESSSFDVNLAELMVELCKENHECQEKHNRCLSEPDALQKALRDITDALLTHSSDDMKIVSSKGVVQPKEFMDALETLNSNKDMLLNLLQDPNSLLFKHILDQQNAQTHEILHGSEPEEPVGCQSSHKQHKHHFFKKKDKSDGAKISNESDSQTSKRIVVLKPIPAQHEHYSNATSPISSPRFPPNLQQQEAHERVSSHFSLKEIRRRLRNMVGNSKKERDLIAMDGVLHKIPYGHQNSDDNSVTSSGTQQTSKLAAFLKNGENSVNLKQFGSQKKVSKPTVDPLDRETAFYEEARKRLIEMLSSDSRSGVSSPRQVTKSLGRTLSLSGYSSSSPMFSPGRDKEIDSPVKLRPSTLRKVQQDDSANNGSSMQSSSTENLPSRDQNLKDGHEAINSTQTLHEPRLHIGELNQKESTDTTEVCGSLDIPVEFCTEELYCSNERCIEEGNILISDSAPPEDVHPLTPSVSIPTNSIVTKKA